LNWVQHRVSRLGLFFHNLGKKNHSSIQGCAAGKIDKTTPPPLLSRLDAKANFAETRDFFAPKTNELTDNIARKKRKGLQRFSFPLVLPKKQPKICTWFVHTK